MTELVVLRVVRPYATESEFLQLEDWTIKKNSVFLVDAPAHTEGTVIRCELVLSSGVQLIVAEGVVAKHVTQTTDRPAGLVVRFRRMTPASTQFINRTLSNRDAEGLPRLLRLIPHLSRRLSKLILNHVKTFPLL